MQSKPTLIVYGATSYTAQFLLAYLDSHPQADSFNIILSGRNETKLKDIHAKYPGVADTVAVELSDEKCVHDLVARGDVIVNFAGPYRKHGAEALIRACAESGTHYIDLSAESSWLSKSIVPKYDYLASKTGACIVPSCGFDSVPSLTNTTTFFRLKGGLSGGTIQTIYDIAETPPTERRLGEWALIADHAPSTRVQSLYTLDHPSLGPKPLYGSFFFMYPYNRTIVRRSWFLSRLNLGNGRDTTSASEPRHGDKLVYKEALQMPSKVRATVFSYVAGLFLGLFFASGLLRKLVSYLLPNAGQGPSQENAEAGYLRCTSVSETTEPSISVVTKYKGKGDPGYLHTGCLLSESALSLILPPPEGTDLPSIGKQGGVLTPSTAMGGVLVERLRRYGKVELSSEIVERSGEGKKDV